MKYSQLYSLLGFIFGWGSPLGSMALRFLAAPNPGSFYQFMRGEWTAYPFFYWYMLSGTCLVFIGLGAVLGRHKDREVERNIERIGS